MDEIQRVLEERYFRPLSTASIEVPADLSQDFRKSGALPQEWLEGARGFGEWFGHRTAPRGGKDVTITSLPQSFAAGSSFASDPAGMRAAEAEGWRLCERLMPFGAVRPTAIHWIVIDIEDPRTDLICSPLWFAETSVFASLEEEGLEVPKLENPGRLRRSVQQAIRAEAAWDIAAQNGVCVSGAAWPPHDVRGRSFAELANPFEPLLALWKTGYLMDCALDERDPILRFFAPLRDKKKPDSSKRAGPREKS